jgi:hypothetical protein
MSRAAALLAALAALLVVLMLTVGKENNFGFACFLVFAVDVVALLGIGLTVVIRRTRRVDRFDA